MTAAKLRSRNRIPVAELCRIPSRRFARRQGELPDHVQVFQRTFGLFDFNRLRLLLKIHGGPVRGTNQENRHGDRRNRSDRQPA